MTKYVISIEEHIVKDFAIEAEDLEEAMELAEERYKAGELILDGDSEVQAKQMMGHDPSDDSYTEWVEF